MRVYRKIELNVKNGHAKYETKVLSGNSFEDESHLQLAEPTRSRVAAYGLFAVASEENLPLSIAERSFTVEGTRQCKARQHEITQYS